MPKGVYKRSLKIKKNLSLLKISNLKVFDDVDIIKKRYESGESSLKIAKDYGVHHKTIIKLLRENNVKIRPIFRYKSGNKFWDNPNAIKTRLTNPEIRKKAIKALMKRPTKPETWLLNLLNRHFPNEWKYVGNGEVLLGIKNPDYINCNGKKLLIELFGRGWHDPDYKYPIKERISYHQTEKGTIEYYKKYGFNCLILWDDELRKKNTFSIIKKVTDFMGIKK